MFFTGGAHFSLGAASFSYFTFLMAQDRLLIFESLPVLAREGTFLERWANLSNPLTKTGRILDRVIDAFAFAAGLLLSFILISVCVEVIMRYFLNRPLQWVIELTEYALLYITFLGTAWLLKREGHITVDVVLNRLNPRIRNLLGIFSSVVGIVICVALVWYGFEVAWDHFRRGVYNPTVLEFPKAPIIAIIPIGSLLLLCQFLRRGYGFLIRLMEKNSDKALKK